MSAWIGVDPGGKHTGVIAVVDGTLVYHATVVRQDAAGDGLVHADYTIDVLIALQHALRALRQAPDRIAIEDVVAPNPHVGMSNPSGVIGAAVIAGAALSWSWEVAGPHGHTLVRPAGHGSTPIPHLYPQALHDPRGGCKQGAKAGRSCNRACVAPNGTQRHVRSAHDVYLAARQQQRIKEAS